MPDEICIDGIHVKRGWPALASCVRTESFEKDDGQGVEGEGGLRRRVARAVVSAVDGTMPLGVRGLKVDAGVSEKKVKEDETAQVQRKTCTDCCELKTQKLAPEADFLKSW